MNKKFQSQRGFSLVEIIIVVVIVGIIAAIAIPSFIASRRAGKESVAKQKLILIGNAQNEFKRTLGRRTYTTLATLQNTLTGEDQTPLLTAQDVDVEDWTLGEGTPTATAFNVYVTPAGGFRDYGYSISQDQVLLKCNGAQATWSPATCTPASE